MRREGFLVLSLASAGLWSLIFVWPVTSAWLFGLAGASLLIRPVAGLIRAKRRT